MFTGCVEWTNPKFNSKSASALLVGISDTLWSKDKFDFDQMKNAAPMRITLLTEHWPFRTWSGVTIPCQNSPVNSPILPVRKASGKMAICTGFEISKMEPYSHNLQFYQILL